MTADIDLGNDDGLFMARIFAAFAAKESGRKSARMKRKYEQNAQQGLPHGPARAFGYEPDKITIREREAAVVRELVGRVIAGESVRALTVWSTIPGCPRCGGRAGPPTRCGALCRRRASPGCASIAGRSSARRCGIRSSPWPSASRCWRRWRRGPGRAPARRAPMCSRGCCAAGAAGPGCSPKGTVKLIGGLGDSGLSFACFA